MDLAEFDIEFLAQKLSENPQSPLFARLADIYLGKEQTVEALQLCDEGVKIFPRYYAGHLVLGKIHLALKEYSKARTAFEQALILSPFNASIVSLISSIPNEPDASTRTTDENYFTPPAEGAAEQVQSEHAIETQAAEPHFESPTAEEMGFTQSVTEIDAAIAAEPQVAVPVSGKTFPTFDEYFAQNQSQGTAGSVSTLDEYLSGSVVAPVVQEENISEDAATPESQNENVAVEPEAEPLPQEEVTPPEHQEPEPVFTSPEQAQLFAEMTGEQPAMEEPSESSANIDELAEKLQNVERIVPQENYQPQSQPEEETQSYETNMVTPTLAEIYASQGEFNAAIQAYEILMFSQPAKAAEFQARIRELQQKQMEKDGLI